mgnify:FL=1
MILLDPKRTFELKLDRAPGVVWICRGWTLERERKVRDAFTTGDRMDGVNEAVRQTLVATRGIEGGDLRPNGATHHDPTPLTDDELASIPFWIRTELAARIARENGISEPETVGKSEPSLEGGGGT